jgi:HD-GYP domain-containing protein (c-di-GMP phosphodiesterase class II)
MLSRRTYRPSSVNLQHVLAILLPLLLYAGVRLSPDPEFDVPHGHFVVVSGVSLLAAVLAALVAWAAVHVRNLEITFLALAFMSLAGFFTVHGLSTPGVMMGPNAVVSIAASLSMASAAFFLLLATLPGDSAPLRWLGAHRGALLAGWGALLLVFAATALVTPHVWDWWGTGGGYEEAGEEGAAGALAVLWEWLLEYHGWLALVMIAVAGVAWRRFLHAYRYARLPLQRALALAAGWILVALFIASTSETWRLSWWLYHLVLLAAVVAMLVGLLRYSVGQGSFMRSLQALALSDPLEQLEQGLSPGLAGLVTAAEVHDPYTAGHGLRVARLGVRIGQELGLAPEALRALGQGGWIHDLGKIGVPHSILNKPGALTVEERTQVESHPEAGYRIAQGIGSLSDELDAIRFHHERWDGAGYPMKLRGEEIPLLARVLAVADVYDALTTKRAYRDAWGAEQTLAFIRSHAGTQFDPACVAAAERLFGATPPEERPLGGLAPTPVG